MSSCDGGLVLPNYTAQLSNSERTSIRSASTVYNGVNTTGTQRFKNTADYIAYKKASSLAYAKQPTINGIPVRPVPTAALLNTVPPAKCSSGDLGGGGFGGDLGGGDLGGGDLGGGGGGGGGPI